MQKTVHFRNATIEDLDLLKRWDEQPHVINSGGADDDYEWEQELVKNSPYSEFLIAQVGEQPIGVIQIIDPKNEETHYWGDVEPNLRAIDIWIGEPDMLNKGYGTQMMKLVIERCFAEPNVTAIIIDPLVSNKDAIRFYKRLGFEFVEYRTFGKDECIVMRLERI
ncbi:MAG: acetyltransferase [Balneolaceae bacterium]|nr:acetyltransferase [Balneolaceae bacterium]MBO6544921.1 acetyltransferase [Balneolaceae bacterium]MBO6646317.1 acetyltransferase [Balneolaceae bacterium]